MSDEQPDLIPVEFIGRGGTLGDLTINGMDVGRYVSAVSFESRAGKHARLVVEFSARAKAHLANPDTAVEIGNDTAELLTSLGWTPPAEQ